MEFSQGARMWRAQSQPLDRVSLAVMCMLKIHNLCIAASDFGDDFEEPDAEDCKRLLTNTALRRGILRPAAPRREQPLMW